MNGIGKIGLPDYRQDISEWNIIVPVGTDRGKYIKNCFLTGTVSIGNRNGERIDNVKIGKLAIQEINFPSDEDSFGSEVLCARSPYSGLLKVVEVYYDYKQYQEQEENQYLLLKRNGLGGVASILTDGDGNIIITASGAAGNGKLIINVGNVNRTGKFQLHVNGDIEIKNDGKANLQTKEMKFKADKIFLNQSDEPVLLGNKTVKLLSDLLDQLSKESAGPYPLLGNATYLKLKEKINDLKSKKSFLE